MKKLGRPMKEKSIMEIMIMEDTIAARRGASLLENRPVTALGQEVLSLFIRLEESAMLKQSINRGLRTTDHKFNEHLARFLGEENLN